VNACLSCFMESFTTNGASTHFEIDETSGN
jgi:hypothetical protein